MQRHSNGGRWPAAPEHLHWRFLLRRRRTGTGDDRIRDYGNDSRRVRCCDDNGELHRRQPCFVFVFTIQWECSRRSSTAGKVAAGRLG
nr:hypothetical protein Iba_chr12eCG15750 [Ipomoea batatas]